MNNIKIPDISEIFATLSQKLGNYVVQLQALDLEISLGLIFMEIRYMDTNRDISR